MKSALRRELAECDAGINAAYWAFTRQARAKPPILVVPHLYARRREILELLRGPMMYIRHASGRTDQLKGRRYKMLRSEILAGRGGPEVTTLVTNGYKAFLSRSGEDHEFEGLLAEFLAELPREILAASTAALAAKLLRVWLARTVGQDLETIPLWDPAKTHSMGYGKYWAVPWEEGPYYWTSIATGSTLNAGTTGVYSTPGPFPEGLRGEGWYAELQNHWMMLFIATP